MDSGAVETVIGRRVSPLTHTIRGVRKLVVRNGWSCQVPAHRTMSGTTRRRGVRRGGVALCGGLAAARGAWLVFEDEAGAREDVVAARADPGGPHPRTLPQTVVHRRTDCY